MKVYILYGIVGVTKAHIEVFNDERNAEHRRNELESMNNGWSLIIEEHDVK